MRARVGELECVRVCVGELELCVRACEGELECVRAGVCSTREGHPSQVSQARCLSLPHLNVQAHWGNQ